MRTIIAAFILLCFSLFSSGQGSKVAHVIKGKVINAETNQPVSYTNIGLEGTLYGTASNDEGDFELKIPENLVSKNIYFSAVGFQNRQFPVQELFDKDFNVVKLQSQSYDVDKIDVEGQNMVLIRILRMASENIRYNNGSGPFNLHCSYTKATTINDSIKTNTSANVLIYDNTGYSKPSPVDAYKSRFYKVSSTDHNYSFSSNLLKIDELLSLDLVRSASGILNPGILSDYNLKLVSQPEIAGKEYWVIGFSQKKPTPEGSGDFYATDFEGTITVNKEDYSVFNITGKVKAPKNNRQDRSLAVADSNTDFLKNVNYEFSVDYHNLLVDRITLSKTYIYQNEHVADNMVLKVERAHANNLTVLNNRNYFPGD